LACCSEFTAISAVRDGFCRFLRFLTVFRESHRLCTKADVLGKSRPWIDERRPRLGSVVVCGGFEPHSGIASPPGAAAVGGDIGGVAMVLMSHPTLEA